MNTGALGTCVSNFGAFDMAGNAWEWVADWGVYAGTSGAGVFAFSAGNGPSNMSDHVGFRYGRRR